ncbi:T9SS type A sorting domain-containing protein [Chitinophagaceae bacterium MMS25-I14]
MKNIFLLLCAAAVMCYAINASAQCNPPTAATVTTTTSTCINNGSIAIRNLSGGGGSSSLAEYAITSSSNPSQPLISYQNDSNFNNIYPGTYTISMRYNCSGTYSTVFTRSATVAGNYQSIGVTFSNIKTSFCNNGGFTVNATQGYTGISGHYTYQLVSAQNASQPDPSPVTAVQSSNTFGGLAAGNYYARVFDDCGNFVTYAVTISSGTVINPFASAQCSMPIFTETQYGCADSVKYFLSGTGFSTGINNLTSSNMALPATVILFLPNGTSDTVIQTTAGQPGALFGQMNINSFVNSGQFGPYYIKYIDACNNTYTSLTAQLDTAIYRSFYIANGKQSVCGGTKYYTFAQVFNCYYACPQLVSGTTYKFKPNFTYLGPFKYSTDNGATWHPNTDSVFIPCSASTVNFTPKIAFCTDTAVSCIAVSVAPCNFAWPAVEMNSFACNGNSGIYIPINGQTMSATGNIKIVFTSVPAGQSAIPPIGLYSADYFGNKFGNLSGPADFHDYTRNLVPGKYVYTVTDTACGTTYTDSITLTHPHQYSISNIAVSQTCTNAAVTVTVSNNSYITPGTIFPGFGDPNAYTLKLVNSSGTIIQSQSKEIPTYVQGSSSGTNGSVQTGTVTFTNVPIGTFYIKLYHDSTIYTYLANPCGPLVDSVTTTISALNVSSSLFLQCGGSSGTIVAKATGGISPYTYELYNGTVTPANLITTQSAPTFTGLNAGQTYSVRVIDNCGTGTAVSKSFAPYAVIIRTTGVACAGNAVTLYVDTITGATYSWTKDGNPLSTTTNTYSIPVLSAADYGTYAATVSIAGCTSFVGTKTIDASSCIPLPISLMSFDASKAGKEVLLTWTTADEKNSSYFEPQRSTDGRLWTALGKISAQGTTALQHNYSFTDNTPASGTNYYRLLMADIDGTHKYSNISTVKFSTDMIGIYPNPVQHSLNLYGNTAAIRSIRLTDNMGRVVYSGNGSVNTVDVSNIPTGMWLLYIRKTDGSVQVEKIIKTGN